VIAASRPSRQSLSLGVTPAAGALWMLAEEMRKLQA
jgi:hypothetical protein